MTILTFQALLMVLLLAAPQSDASQYETFPRNTKVDAYEPCGCFYNIYANMPKVQRDKQACAKNCVYRTINGRCNNRCNPNTWGVALLPYGRLLKPDYCEAVASDAPRCSSNGDPLPGSRDLSVLFFQEKPEKDLDVYVTSAHMVFGQFLSHDLARTNEPKLTDDNGDDLCGRNQCNENDVCFPIQVSPGDPDFPPSQCLRFHRSTRRESPLHECRDQQNDISSYLDLNTVYGSTEGEMEILRDARPKFSAYLNMTSWSQLNIPGATPGKDILPQIDGVKTCRGKTDQIKCFMAGDRRVGEQVQLSVLHTIFAREHNRLVYKLDVLNLGCWSQERLFQEARKINIAQWQVVVYNEYLRVMFSTETMRKFDLFLNGGDYFYGYDKNVNATVSNVFQTSSFRFGHTQIASKLALATNKFETFEEIDFSAVFNSPTLLYVSGRPGVTGTDAITFGMTIFPSEFTDDFFNPEITRSFDAETVHGLGRDLEALDIERGRDHGLPSYNEWRKWCNLPYATNGFNEFVDIPENLRMELADVYDSFQDVDLFLGAMLETLEDGALVGPTFSCLNAEQFRRVRIGDRFWHENPKAGLTKSQLKSISRITFAKILCNNLDDAKMMQPNVFIQPRSRIQSLMSNVQSEWGDAFVYSQKVDVNQGNELMLCDDIDDTDLTLWQEPDCWNKKCSGSLY